MSEQSPETNSVSPEHETPAAYHAHLLSLIEQAVPAPYSETDIDNAHDDDEIERMLGYNAGWYETLEAVRKVLSVAETDVKRDKEME